MTFAHDGLRDSLTHLAAPPYFYENLRRELATAQRNKSTLLLIRFQLIPNKVDSDEFDSHEVDSTGAERASIYEQSILSFAETIKNQTRAEDLCARLGQYEFTMIVKAGVDVGRNLSRRVMESWRSDDFVCTQSLVQAAHGESSLELLNRLDNEELLPYSRS